MLDVSSSNKAQGLSRSRAASNKAAKNKNKGKGPGGRSSYVAPRSNVRASQPASRPRKSGTISRNPVSRKSRPILPVPSADAIADLFNQIAGFRRESGQLGANARAQKSELGAARGLYLKQLADAFTQQRTSTMEDFASRGLSDSGLQNEALARLQNVYAGQQSEYETSYRSQLAEIMRTLQGRRSDIAAQRLAAERRYNQLRAQRAAALRSAGFGG